MRIRSSKQTIDPLDEHCEQKRWRKNRFVQFYHTILASMQYSLIQASNYRDEETP